MSEGWPIWEGFARGSRLEAHSVLLEAAEGSLRKNHWSRRGLRKLSKAERDAIVVELAEILARLVSEDYARANELGVDLVAAAKRTRGKPRQRPRRVARVLSRVGVLTDQERYLEWYAEGHARLIAKGKTAEPEPRYIGGLKVPDVDSRIRDHHRRYLSALEMANGVRDEFGLQPAAEPRVDLPR
jgi:hypothetical protein